MKVEGTRAGSATDKTGRARLRPSVAPGQFARTLGAMIGVDDAPAPVAGAGAVSGVDALLAVQDAAEDSQEGRRRLAYDRGHDQLDQLAKMQRAMALGDLSMDALARLARLVDEPRPMVDDPRLHQILDEIDVRVRVELAKQERLR